MAIRSMAAMATVLSDILSSIVTVYCRRRTPYESEACSHSSTFNFSEPQPIVFPSAVGIVQQKHYSTVRVVASQASVLVVGAVMKLI